MLVDRCIEICFLLKLVYILGGFVFHWFDMLVVFNFSFFDIQ